MIVFEGYSECGVLKYNSTGRCVELLQTYLNALGYSLTVDGIFGSNTRNAVMQYQKSKGISSDGIVGPITWDKLETDIISKYGRTQLENMKSAILKIEKEIYRPAETIKPVEVKSVYKQPEMPVRAGIGLNINTLLLIAGAGILAFTLFSKEGK